MASSKDIVIPYSMLLSSLRPIIDVKFKEKETQYIPCLLDSGADISTFPTSIGTKIGIDFSDEDPVDPPKQISGDIKCKCYQVAKSIYLKWQKEEITLPIMWVDSNEVDPVLGRKGFFDKFKEVAFCEEKKKIILRK